MHNLQIFLRVLAIILPISVLHAAPSSPPIRSQEPQKPYPYQEEKVFIQNTAAMIHLAGTFCKPNGKGPFPAVVLISGSGPQNRDQEILGHRPFLILSDHLVRHGIAVLRMDDRGVGESEGDYGSALNHDFIEDALCAVKYLRTCQEINTQQIGLIGHSLGGVLAPFVAQETDISFMILLAAPSLKGIDFMTHRDRFFLEFANIQLPASRVDTSTKRWGEINRVLMSECSHSEVNEKIRPLLKKEIEEISFQERKLYQELGMELKVDVILREINTLWYRDNLKCDPQIALREIKCPVMALYGDKDLFVPADRNREALEAALAQSANTNVTVKTLSGINHFLQTSETGMPIEVYMSKETIAPSVLSLISDWIKMTLPKETPNN